MKKKDEIKVTPFITYVFLSQILMFTLVSPMMDRSLCESKTSMYEYNYAPVEECLENKHMTLGEFVVKSLAAPLTIPIYMLAISMRFAEEFAENHQNTIIWK